MTLTSYDYKDPAAIAERRDLIKKGCRACAHHKLLLGRVVCGNSKVSNQRKVPKIGIHCKHFKLEY